VVENFFAIFLMVIPLTSFQDPSCITLKEVRLIKVTSIFCPEAASTTAFF
jgi:hypothetical protein